MKTAQPIYVSEYCTEVSDNEGHYIGESRVIVQFKGNCIPRAVLGGVAVCPPEARGGSVYHINYISESDISVVEYRFKNTGFNNRFKTSEKFRQKMLKKIKRQRIKDCIAQINEKYR